MKVKVTKQHIAEGVPGQSYFCPIALAVKSKLGLKKWVYVSGHSINIAPQNGQAEKEFKVTKKTMNQEHQAHNALVDTLHVLLGYSKRQLISDVLSAVLSIFTSIFFIVYFQYVLLGIVFLILTGMMLTFALREYEFYKETKDVLKHLKIIEKE